MKAENSAKIQFDSLSANEAFARGAAAAFLARYDPTVPQLADIKTAVSEARLLYTSDAADERSSVDLGGRRIIKKKTKTENHRESNNATNTHNKYEN